MANGDAAAAAGMDVVAATADVRLGYSEVNKTRDYLAGHETAGTHPASAIASGVLALARIPVLDVARIPNLPASKIAAGYPATSVGTSAFGFPTNVDAALVLLDARIDALPTTTAADTVTSGAYGRTVGGANFAMWMDGALNIGRNVSSIRYKDQVEDCAVTPTDVLALRPVTYHRIGADESEREFGLIAEEVNDTLPEIVTHYGGQIDGVRYDLLAVALLAVVQDQQQQLDTLRARVDALEGIN